MPRFRDALTGRFVAAANVETWRSEGRSVITSWFAGEEPEPEEEPEEDQSYYVDESTGVPNWDEIQTARGLVWSAYDDSDGDPDSHPVLDPEALQNMSFPEGYSRFQIRFAMPDNPSYPRGFASYDTLTDSEWPPDPSWGDGIGAVGIGAIVFYR